jgi:hypothetical protein
MSRTFTPVVMGVAVAALLCVAACTKEPARKAHPDCEVELAGTVTGAPVAAMIVAVGDCLAPGAKVLGTATARDGRWAVEVFAPWGSDLSVCATGQNGARAKAKKRIHAEAAGEIIVGGVDVVLPGGDAPPAPAATPDAGS